MISFFYTSHNVIDLCQTFDINQQCLAPLKCMVQPASDQFFYTSHNVIDLCQTFDINQQCLAPLKCSFKASFLHDKSDICLDSVFLS